MKKVRKLREGSNIAIISPSNGLPSLFPGIYDLGLKNLEDFFGYNIIEMPSARMDMNDLYENPKLRADDINTAFKDKSIDGIICSIGGYESVRILEYLDIDTILNNPKLIMGFSDASTFLTYLNTLGLVTFYGPSVMAGIAQLDFLPNKYKQHLKDIFINITVPYRYTPYDYWTEGYINWNDMSTLGQCTEAIENPQGFEFLLGGTDVEGMLFGGCIEVLEFLKGTKYWPSEEFWNNKILFLESSEEKPSPRQIGYMLRNYGVQGVLGRINGLLIARPKDYTLEEKVELKDTVLKILKDEFHVCDIPVVFNVDFGHTDPKLVLPMGCRAMISPAANEIVLLESPFVQGA